MGIRETFVEAIKAVARGGGGQASNDPNFASGLQFYTPGQPIWTDKNYGTFVREGYKKNPTVYTCINKISGAAAGISWKLYKDRSKGAPEIENHALLDLWRKPNPSMPGTGSFVEQSFGYWHMAGNNYIYAYRPSPSAPPLALWTLRPDRMKAVAGQRGIENYVYGYDSNTPVVYELPDILHMKFPGYDNDTYGLSPIEVASYYSDQQNEAMGWNISLMQNAGRPASVFFSKGILTPDQRNQITQEIRKKYSGKRNAGRPLILEADMTWQNMSLTPMELDFLKSFELGTRQIAAIFDIAPELVGDSAGKTFANVAEARQSLYLENVLPKLDRMSDYLSSWLVPMYPDLAASGAYFTYDKDDIEALQALYSAQKKAVHDMARADWMAGGITLDEYRDAIGQKPAKFGAVYRFGAILVSEDSMEDYADQSLAEPAAPPPALAEPLNVPGALPGQPALPPGKKPAPAIAGPKPPQNPKAPKDLTGPAPAKSYTSVFEVKAYGDNPAETYGSNTDSAVLAYQPDDLDAQLKRLRAAGVEYVKWVSDGHPCPICDQNDGVIVKLGDPFPSGHILPQAHPNCKCQAVPVAAPASKTYDLFIASIARKRAEKRERYIVHEQNRPAIKYTDATLYPDPDGSSLQLRFLPVPPQEGSAQQKSTYRQFLEKLT